MDSDDNEVSSEELEEKSEETDEKEDLRTDPLEDTSSNIDFLRNFTEHYTNSYFGGESLRSFMNSELSPQQIQIVSWLVSNIQYAPSNLTIPGGRDDSEVVSEELEVESEKNDKNQEEMIVSWLRDNIQHDHSNPTILSLSNDNDLDSEESEAASNRIGEERELIESYFEIFPIEEQTPLIYDEYFNMVIHRPIMLGYISSLRYTSDSIEFFRNFTEYATNYDVNEEDFQSFMDRGMALEDALFAVRLIGAVPSNLMQSALNNRQCDVYELAIIYRNHTEDEIIRAFCAEDPNSITAQDPHLYFYPLYDNQENSSYSSSTVTNSGEEFPMFFGENNLIPFTIE